LTMETFLILVNDCVLQPGFQKGAKALTSASHDA